MNALVKHSRVVNRMVKVLARVEYRVKIGKGFGREDEKDGSQHLQCHAKEFRFHFVDCYAFEQRTM